MPIRGWGIINISEPVLTPPGTPTFGFDASGPATTARNGTGAAPTDGSLVGRILGPNGEVWSAEADDRRPTFRADRFGPGRHGIETGIGQATGMAARQTVAYGDSWSVYFVLESSPWSMEGRLLSTTNNDTTEEYSHRNGFDVKLFGGSPRLAVESRNAGAFQGGPPVPVRPLPSGKCAIGLSFYAESGIVVETMGVFRYGSIQLIGGTCTTTRTALGYWIDLNFAEPTRSIIARMDAYAGAHQPEEMSKRLRWYRSVYGESSSQLQTANDGGPVTIG